MYFYNGTEIKKIKPLIEDCISKCQAINIPIAEEITFTSMNGERTYGITQLNRYTKEYTIKISKRLVKEEDIKNTIIHELLHTCKGCLNHGYQWNAYGSRIERNYGYVIQRCDNKEVVSNVASSRRVYFTKNEYEANKDILVAIAVEDEETPRWFVKRTSKLAQRYAEYKVKLPGGIIKHLKLVE